MHALPDGQRVPVPHAGPPGHTLGTGWPHVTLASAPAGGHAGAHSHMAVSVLQRWPAGHPELQRPPQPSSDPHAAFIAQLGVHEHWPVVGLHVCRGSGHWPMQRPPQPSSAPHMAPIGQLGVHWHVPNTQRSFAPRMQGDAQPQVSTQRPLTHTLPGMHVTAEHGLVMHSPLTQNWLSAQVTPSHGVRGEHETWQAKPSGHMAPQR